MGNVLYRAPVSRRGPRREEPLANPGSFDELHRKCKEVFPQQMEGVKLIINKALSSHFQVSHTIHMSTIGQSNYHLNATFVGDQQTSPTEDSVDQNRFRAKALHLRDFHRTITVLNNTFSQLCEMFAPCMPHGKTMSF